MKFLDIFHAATGQEVALTWTCDFNEIEDNFTINALIVKNFIKDNNGDSRFFIIFVLLNKTTVPRNVPLLVQELFVLKKT
jgi:hypothetical protein